jgi:hypothetical protein
MELPSDLKPGMWGCAHGTGFFGAAIRDAQMRMTQGARFPHGDKDASWAGHCVIFIGDHNFGTALKPDIAPAIVQAEWPKVEISRATAQADVIWATGQPLSDAQLLVGVGAAKGMVGMHYDIRAYAWYLATVARLHVPFEQLFANKKMAICSGTVVREQEAMHVDIGPLRTAATESPDYVCPADCMRWGLDNGWMSRPVPAW